MSQSQTPPPPTTALRYLRATPLHRLEYFRALSILRPVDISPAEQWRLREGSGSRSAATPLSPPVLVFLVFTFERTRLPHAHAHTSKKSMLEFVGVPLYIVEVKETSGANIRKRILGV